MVVEVSWCRWYRTGPADQSSARCKESKSVRKRQNAAQTLDVAKKDKVEESSRPEAVTWEQSSQLPQVAIGKETLPSPQQGDR